MSRWLPWSMWNSQRRWYGRGIVSDAPPGSAVTVRGTGSLVGAGTTVIRCVDVPGGTMAVVVDVLPFCVAVNVVCVAGPSLVTDTSTSWYSAPSRCTNRTVGASESTVMPGVAQPVGTSSIWSYTAHDPVAWVSVKTFSPSCRFAPGT